MNLNSIVILSIMFNLSLNVISAVGVGVLPMTYTPASNQASAVPLIANGTASSKALLGSAQCTIPANATIVNYVTCNPIVTGLQGVYTTMLTFGIWLWGLANVAPLMLTSILLPASFLTTFGVDPRITAIFQVSLSFIYLMWIFVLVTGRYQGDIS